MIDDAVLTCESVDLNVRSINTCMKFYSYVTVCPFILNFTCNSVTSQLLRVDTADAMLYFVKITNS